MSLYGTTLAERRLALRRDCQCARPAPAPCPKCDDPRAIGAESFARLVAAERRIALDPGRTAR